MRKNYCLIICILLGFLSLNACAKKTPAPVITEKTPVSPPKEEKKSLEAIETPPPAAVIPIIPSEKVEVKDLGPITAAAEEVIEKKETGENNLNATIEGKDIAGITEKESKIIFEDIYFDYDKFGIKKEMQDKLTAYAQWLKANPHLTLEIEGHCDERGTVEYNLALGEKRANAIKKYLISLLSPAQTINTISFGEERPINSGHNEEAWQKNRRGHFNLKQ